MSQLRDQLFQEIHMARQRVYSIGAPTPLERLSLAGQGNSKPRKDMMKGGEVFLKREDLSPIHAYKWRGAYNRMALLTQPERERGVIAASAGNHAQGVALAAKKLGTRATIYMPLSTPRMKQTATAKHGGESVEIILHGDTYDEAAAEATRVADGERRAFIHPYDDLRTMGGQGTLADEVVMSGEGPFEVAFLQIGGGGLAASVACWLKSYYPEIYIVGVEGIGQAAMHAAIEAGEPTELYHLDIFCDGTAVRKVGNLTYPLCNELIDEFMTVTNDEVCAAIQVLWEERRCVPEPAGAMGLAGLLKRPDLTDGKRALSVLAGANMDFGQLAWIARHAGIGAARRRYFRFEIGERPGEMLQLLQTVLDGINIIEFQYGKTHETKAFPVIGFEASPPELHLLDQRLAELGITHEDVTNREDVDFRIIHYEPALFHSPFFIKLEFPERAGALHDFLEMASPAANLCYFNYAYTGERVGRALMGFEFTGEDQREEFYQILKKSGWVFVEIREDTLDRIL